MLNICLYLYISEKTRNLLFQGAQKPSKLSTEDSMSELVDPVPQRGQLRLDASGGLCCKPDDSTEVTMADAQVQPMEFGNFNNNCLVVPAGQLQIDSTGHLCSGVKGWCFNPKIYDQGLPLRIISAVEIAASWWPFSKNVFALGMYCQTSNISGTLGNEIVNQLDLVGASPVGGTLTTSSCSTPGFNGLGKDNCETRRGTFWDLVHLILGDCVVLWHSSTFHCKYNFLCCIKTMQLATKFFVCFDF